MLSSTLSMLCELRERSISSPVMSGPLSRTAAILTKLETIFKVSAQRTPSRQCSFSSLGGDVCEAERCLVSSSETIALYFGRHGQLVREVRFCCTKCSRLQGIRWLGFGYAETETKAASKVQVYSPQKQKQSSFSTRGRFKERFG